MLGGEGRLSSLKWLLGGKCRLGCLERLLGSIGGVSCLERLLRVKGSLQREWRLAGVGGLRLNVVGRLWGLKGLLSSVCRLRLGLLREKRWSRSSPQLS